MIRRAIGEVLAFGWCRAEPVGDRRPGRDAGRSGRRPRAWAFAGTWVLSLTLVSTLVLLLADGADASANGAPATWVSIVKIVVGLLLVLFGVRQWRGA